MTSIKLSINMEINQLIGKNLSSFRDKLGYSQQQVADYLKVDRSLIAHYERGKRDISIVHLQKIADLFNVELETFAEVDAHMALADQAFAFRSEANDAAGLQAIANFQKVVKNYLKMKKLGHE